MESLPENEQKMPQTSEVDDLSCLQLLKKAMRPYVDIAYKILGFWILGVLRILQPLVKIRVGLLTNYGRIGHLSGNTELFLRRQARRKDTGKEFYIFFTGRPANKQLLKMIKRRLTVVANRHAHRIYNVSLRKTDFNIYLPQQANEYDEFINAPPQLSFNPKEEAQGRELLASMGIEPDTRYICFHARDKAYLDSLYSERSREEGAYHDYKDCDVNNYLPAAEHLTSLGYTALRMGEIVEQEFLATKHNRIVDYASQFRSDFGDIYLLAQCAFFLGNVSGLWVVASCFNTPIAIANVIPLVFVPMRSDGLFIPKKLWDIRRKRFLTFREILMCGADEWLRTERYTQAGFEAIENTAEEILLLGKEMHERLEGKWISTEEDEDLQARYRSFFLPEHRCYGFPSRIGAEFLRQNQELLV